VARLLIDLSGREVRAALERSGVDAPDLHDGDRAGRRSLRDRQIGTHLAVAQLDPDVLRFQSDDPFCVDCRCPSICGDGNGRNQGTMMAPPFTAMTCPVM
jgi:hypothetical protein